MRKREPARIDYHNIGDRYDAAFHQVENLLAQNSIEPILRQLVKIRAAQIDGSLYHLDKHIKIAKILGERELRLHHIAIWHDSDLFNDRERAALQWAELLTQLQGRGISRKDYDYISEFFSEEELVDLSFIIATANARHRLAAAFLPEVGSDDARLNLNEAGLS